MTTIEVSWTKGASEGEAAWGQKERWDQDYPPEALYVSTMFLSFDLPARLQKLVGELS